MTVFTAAIRADLKFSEKSKKEKVRSLSAVGRALSSCQMGCHVSEKEEAHEPSSSGVIATSKRFKVPKNVCYYVIITIPFSFLVHGLLAMAMHESWLSFLCFCFGVW